jgi:hypothetical protein
VVRSVGIVPLKGKKVKEAKAVTVMRVQSEYVEVSRLSLAQFCVGMAGYGLV